VDRRLATLFFGNFVIGTGTLAVPGMLTRLAEAFSVEVPVAGRLVAAFALTICLTAPVLAAVTSRLERRTLLAVTMAAFSVGHVGAALAPSYETLLLARVVSAVSAGLFTAQAAGVAGLLVPPERRGAAIAAVFLGWSIAAVLGLPMANQVSAAFGFRAVFAIVAVAAAMGTGLLRVALPGGLFVTPIDGAAWGRLLRNSAVLLTVLITFIQAWAQFTLFSYMTPYFTSVLGSQTTGVSALLAVVGLAGIVGNVLAARLLDRLGPSAVVAASIGSMALGHSIILLAGASLPLAVVGLVGWGLGCFAINSGQQVRLVTVAPTLAPVGIALNTVGMYLGQAAGAETGGRVIAWASVTALTQISVPLLALALVLSIWSLRRATPPIAAATVPSR
jgi:predicted MFS family arabinose efflux permease